ncbi:MAG: hypothetical protein V1773_17460 [bacterium]
MSVTNANNNNKRTSEKFNVNAQRFTLYSSRVLFVGVIIGYSHSSTS